MNDPRLVTATAELEGALRCLDQLSELVGEGEAAYRDSLDRRGCVRYLWIVVGSRLKNYCKVMGVLRASGQFGQAIGFRHKLAYERPDLIDEKIVWRTCFDDVPLLRQVIRETMNALGP